MMFDLQTLIPPGSDMRLVAALVINDRGEIGGITGGLLSSRKCAAMPSCSSHVTTIVLAMWAASKVRARLPQFRAIPYL